MTTAPLLGEKRPTTRKTKKKGKSVAGGNEATDNLVSLISKNQEMKIAHIEAWFAKHKGTLKQLAQFHIHMAWWLVWKFCNPLI